MVATVFALVVQWVARRSCGVAIRRSLYGSDCVARVVQWVARRSCGVAIRRSLYGSDCVRSCGSVSVAIVSGLAIISQQSGQYIYTCTIAV
jgi:hypothetical protein